VATILIIDDEPAILLAMERVLAPLGHEVLKARNGRTALERYMGHRADLVITDIFMPEMDGIELIMRMKAAFPTARIVAMSGGGALARDNVLGAAAMLGVDGVLEKPFELHEISEVVDRVLELPGR
jgi:CheY-like chemotaxis protein